MTKQKNAVPSGELESAVLHCLWAADGPLTPRDVMDEIDRELAYTTIMTTLTRLHQKGLASRVKAGRAFAYEPTLDEPGFHAARMSEPLQVAGDRQAALLRFVESLPKHERSLLMRSLSPQRPT